ncbi:MULTISPECIES: LLM class flavin-dependent oxidoreductase [Kribbella]|uniref:Alkanesulfonate monooxygenase SsuD/methylene tetrahydromethanopterin reductase-like flavin-dependent oxidoreductase (Luciferase family) n=1 Tax=Kribbella pratensis TaxID=2512112 RepID=A0ABY2F8E8_9ACTN|nr:MULTISPECIES: LLM class flavin-dependent oxidoreductase [Kribbella]TDW86784.1 alkanesulfonate monooxygenase SsuD/methylene tetrahydromethanopterin reductase-like flavin-dependent oxidoreductase (luciferase family) [Kribbella pratensis]TDW91893.1 alkanesulfonate monooxygenase SsuD/methylene tetrahydromethanopterin reductase-like flavin-dependent oxidoreductase (luciferase family) [Kribbella sp. VKM Ac-2566]
MTALGMCFPRTYPAALVTDVARRLDRGGADELWIIEDCFFTAGPSLVSAALTSTERLTVGLGIVPAVARTAAVTAMEFATLEALGPGRFLPGIGHGVQSWMGQMGVRPKSPLTALEEVTTSVTRLLRGEEVSFEGKTVFLDKVKLDAPPAEVPPILLGVQGPKSMALAGRVAGGVVLAEPATAPYVRQSVEYAGSPEGFVVAVFAAMCVREDRKTAYEWTAPWLGWRIGERPPQLTALPFFDEMKKLYDASGEAGLVGMPSDWWTAIGAIGTLDDAAAHVETLEAAGVQHVGLFPDPEVEHGLPQLDYVLELANR